MQGKGDTEIVAARSPGCQGQELIAVRERDTVLLRRIRPTARVVMLPEDDDLYRLPQERSAESTVWARSIVTVIGPSPPGTGVMASALALTDSKSMSPTSR